MAAIDEIRTRELSLATFLVVNGFEPSHTEMVNDRTAEWVFLREDGIADLVAEYRCGDAEVEPKEFVRSLSRVRRDMYAFVRDHGDRP